jgi:hypothetical protein
LGLKLLSVTAIGATAGTLLGGGGIALFLWLRSRGCGRGIGLAPQSGVVVRLVELLPGGVIQLPRHGDAVVALEVLQTIFERAILAIAKIVKASAGAFMDLQLAWKISATCKDERGRMISLKISNRLSIPHTFPPLDRNAISALTEFCVLPFTLPYPRV